MTSRFELEEGGVWGSMGIASSPREFCQICARRVSSKEVSSIVRQSPLLQLILIPMLFFCLPQCSDDEPTGPQDGQDTTVVVVLGIDTTTHRYSWQSYEIGNVPSGTLYAVSAVSETNAYAVGEYYMRDTSNANGEEIKFNAVRWDGSQWNYEVISPGSPEVDSNLERQTTLWGVWGEEPNNYTFTSSNQIVYHDGVSTVTDLHFWAKQDSQSCRHMWGPENDRWFYGNAGWITRGEGRIYIKQPRLTVAEITGMCASNTGIWAVASYRGNTDLAILRYHLGQWVRMNDSVIADDLNCTQDVWCDENGMQEGGFIGFVGKNICYHDSTWHTLPPKYLTIRKFFNAIHGSMRNNVFAVGTNGAVFHYNGKSWTTYPDLYSDRIYYKDVWVTENRVFIVGSIGVESGFSHAYVTIGTRVE